MVQAASRDPRTRWCFTVVNGQGAASFTLIAGWFPRWRAAA
jgi:hypothetical protein